jgi:hypothetical protein
MTTNADLWLSYPNTWDPYVWNWDNQGFGERVENDEYSWVYWHDGYVNMLCEDHGGGDTIWLATNFDQTEDQGLKIVQMNRLNLWFEATILGITGTPIWMVAPWDWTGAKFDFVAVEDGTGRIIMMEMYIWRTGADLIWGTELIRETEIGSGVYNYLVALDHMSDYANETADGNLRYYRIDVLGLLKRCIDKFNNEYEGIDPLFDIANFKSARVDFALESGQFGGVYGPWVFAILDYLRARYDTADVNADGTCDADDVDFVTAHYGTQRGDSSWDFRADLDTNGVVNQLDIDYVNSKLGTWYTSTGGGHPGGGECPTLFVWNGTDYVSEGVLPIHAESDVTVPHTIQNTSLTPENGVYRVELRELDNYTSHLDQVRLYAVDGQGEWHLSPLLYADHSELGRVTWKLRFDDENRVDMMPTQTIALRFLPSIPYSQTAYFVFEVNGHNRKVLY